MTEAEHTRRFRTVTIEHASRSPGAGVLTKVLLVEDSRTQAVQINLLLDFPGEEALYELVHVTTCAEAVAQATGQRFDVMLVDLTLPDASGVEAVHELVGAAPETPIVVLTATTDESTAIEAVHAGAEDYLTKGDLSANLLRRTIRYAMERYELHAELNRFFTLSADLFGIAMEDGTLARANAAWERVLGVPVEEVVGSTLAALVVAEDLPAVERAYYEIETTPHPVGFQCRTRDAGGRIHWLEFEAQFVATQRAIFLSGRDITRRKKLERAKAEIVGVVSHELRNPLATIIGAVEILGDEDLPGATRSKFTSMAHSGAERMLRIVNDLLDVERLDAGGMPMQMEPCDPMRLVTNVVEATATPAAVAEVAIDTASTGSAGPRQLLADPNRMTQALVNLVTNAIKFSPSGGTIHLSVHPNETQVEFRVSDAGRGIPPEKLQTIFDRFEQVDIEDARTKRGTGLGLAITKGIVEQHGGRIWAESEVDRGSTFHVIVPVGGPDDGREPAGADSADSADHFSRTWT